MTKKVTTDLFGNGQHSLFGDSESLIPNPKAQTYTPDPDHIRKRLHGLLDTARSASRMPWSDRDSRMWQVVFPQMANWLPDDEANQLRFEFAQELERLRLAA